jgi:hypothetical protein
VVAVEPGVSFGLELADGGVGHRLGDQTIHQRGECRGSGDALGPAAEAVVDEELLDRRLAHDIAPVCEAVAELAAAQRRFGHRQGEKLMQHVGRCRVWQLWPSLGLGHQRLKTVGACQGPPLVERLAGDAEGPTRQRDVARLARQQERCVNDRFTMRPPPCPSVEVTC